MGKKVLIADDDLGLLEALRVRFEATGLEVMTTQDAYQALGAARRFKPDVLLLDVNMPAGQGFSVQERIANIDELRNTPVVYMTGQSIDDVQRTAQKLGAFAVVYKPFEADKLLETIRAALGYWVYPDQLAATG